jgi:DNA-binding beta-propeller fold protein YncE
VVATVPVGRLPAGIAYDSTKGELFVTNYLDNTVSVISDSNKAPPGPNPLANTVGFA